MSVAEWCVLIAGLLPVLTVGIAKAGPGYDNGEPRRWAESLLGYRRRAHAAHLNHFEAFPLFAVAVLVAQLHHGPSTLVDGLASAFVLARVGYTAAYVTDRATLRSVLWIGAWAATLAIFLTAAWR